MRKAWMMGLLVVSTVVGAQALSGKEVFETACKNCHSPEFAKGIGAPPAHDVQAWEARLANAGKEVKANPAQYKDELDYLVQRVIKGKGLMHHGGLCKESVKNPDACTPEAYRLAIEYMKSAA